MRRLWEAIEHCSNSSLPGNSSAAKTMVVDGILALIGTTNLDNRSFALNEEINLIVHDAAIAGSA